MATEAYGVKGETAEAATQQGPAAAPTATEKDLTEAGDDDANGALVCGFWFESEDEV